MMHWKIKKVNIKYIETQKDREQGLKIFNSIYNIYGSRILLLALAIAFFIVFLVEILFHTYIIGLNYFGLIITSILIWHFGIRYHIYRKKFIEKRDRVYIFNLDNDTLQLDNAVYSIKKYYSFNDYLFFVYTNGYVTVLKNNLDKRILNKYDDIIEESYTWKDTLLWSMIGLIIYSFISYITKVL